MHLWIFNREFPPNGLKCNTGVVKAVHGLAGGLVQAGLKVTVLCENTADSVVTSPSGYTIRCFANPKHNQSFSRLSEGLCQFIANADYPVLAQLNGIFNPSVFRMSRELRKAGIAYIAAPHDPYHPEIFRRRRLVKTIYWHLFEARMLRQACCVQILDKRHEHWLRRLNISTPVLECVNGFFPEDLAAIPQPVWNEKATTDLLFLGRLDIQNKGLDLLIKAFKGVGLAHQDAHLTIQGPDWGDRQQVIDLIAEGDMESRISLKEADYQTRPTTIISQHDIFCLPSRFEGFGLSALEAMLAGRVLLVTDIAGIAPHVRQSDCGVVVDSSVAAIADGIEQLLARRSQWREMGLRGRQYALDHLTWEQIGAQAAQKYQKLLAQTEHARSRTPTDMQSGGSLQKLENVSLPGQ